MIILSNKGIRPETKKNSALDRAIEIVQTDDFVLVPVYLLGELELLPVCDVGKTVYRNAVLAVSKDGKQGIISPVSGVFLGTETIFHPLCGEMVCAKIGVNNRLPDAPTEKFDRIKVSAEEIISIAKGAGIIDEFDGMPLYQKLCAFRDNNTELLAGNAIDDTPYCSSAVKTVCEWGSDAASGLELCMRAVGAARGAIYVYDGGGKDMRRIKDKYSIIDVVRVSGKYPVWPALEKHLTRKFSFGAIGVQALRALFLAVTEGIPQRTVLVTVAGNGVAQPCNCEVTVGTPVSVLLEKCKIKPEAKYVVLGNAMNGACCEEDTELSVPVYPGMRAVTVLTKREVLASKSRCIGCGRCIEACPVNIMPMYIAQFAQQGNIDEALEYLPEKCNGCGVCSAVCPAGRELYSVISLLKAGVYED